MTEQIKPSGGRLIKLADSWGDTEAIMAAIIRADNGDSSIQLPPAMDYIIDFVPSIPGDTVHEVCQYLYEYITTKIDYVDDNDKPAWKWLLQNKPDTQSTDTAAIEWVKQHVKGLGYYRDRDGNMRLEESADWQIIQQPGELWDNRKRELGGTGLGGDCKSMTNFCSACIRALYGDIYCDRVISQDGKKDYHHVYTVVYDEDDKEIILDCVMDGFDEEVPHKKQKDMYPRPAQKGIRGPITIPTLGGNSSIGPGMIQTAGGGTVNLTIPTLGRNSGVSPNDSIQTQGGGPVDPTILPPAPGIMSSPLTWLLLAGGLYLIFKD